MSGGKRKCYYKRNKDESRTFRPCDAARIAKNAEDRGAYTDDEVIRCVGRRLGYFAIALSGRGEEPDDKLTDLLNKALIGIRKVKKALEVIRGLFESVLSPIDDFLDLFEEFEEVTESAKSVLGKLIQRISGKIGSKKRKIKAAVKVVQKTAEKIREISDEIQELIETFDRLIGLASKLNAVRNAKVYLLSDKINDCNCGDKENG